MEEFHVTDPTTGRILAGDSHGEHDGLAVEDVENGVLFRYHPADDRAVRSQFIAVDEGGARDHRVAVTKFGSDRVDLSEHARRISEWADAVDSAVPGSTSEWSPMENEVQRFHMRLINGRGSAGADVSAAFDRPEPVTVDAPRVATAADIVNHALKLDPGSIAVSLHGRTDALDDVDVVIHAGHGDSTAVRTAERDDRDDGVPRDGAAGAGGRDAAGGRDGTDERDGTAGAADTARGREGGPSRADAEPDERGTSRSAAPDRGDDERRREPGRDRAGADDANADRSGEERSGRRDRAPSDPTPSPEGTASGGETAAGEGTASGGKTPAGEDTDADAGSASTADGTRSTGSGAAATPTEGPDATSGTPDQPDSEPPDPPSGPETPDESPDRRDREDAPRKTGAAESGPAPVGGSPVPADATVPPAPFDWSDPSAADEPADQTEPVSWFPTAPGLSVFDGPTGRLVYDESGRLTPDETYGAANDVYLDDLLFYHNPAAGEVIAYTNGRVGGANQQLLVHYLDPDADDLLSEFLRATERLFADRSGWAIARDVGNYQEVFNGLDDDATAEPAVSSEELDSVLRPGTRLDFGTPSAREAIEFVTYLRDERGFDGTVAISGSGRADFLDGVDVVVMPSSLNYTEVAPRAQTGDRIAFARLADRAAAAKREFIEVRERSVDGEVPPRRWQETLATAVSEASERAPTLRPAPAYRLQQASKALVVAATAAVLFVAALAYLAWSGLGGEFAAALTEPVTVRPLPGIETEALSPVQPLVVPLWGLLTAVGGIVTVGAAAAASKVGGVHDAFKPLAYLAGGGPDALDPKSAEQLRSMRQSIGAAGELIEEVDDEFLGERLTEWYEADGIDAEGLIAAEPADQYLEVVFEHAVERINIVDPAVETRRRREWLMTGIAGGVAVGAVAAAATVGVAYAFTAELAAAVFGTVVFGQLFAVGLLVAGVVAVTQRGD